MKEAEIKIGINIGNISSTDRGISVYTHNLLMQLAQIESNCRYSLFHYPGNTQAEKFRRVHMVPEQLPYSGKDNPIRTIINEQVLNPWQQLDSKLDVIWHPHNRCQFFVPCAYVCTMHDVLAISHPELANQYLGKMDKKVLYLSRTMTANRSDMIIAISNFGRNEIIKHLRVDPSRVITIYNGIDKKVFKPNINRGDWERIKRTYSLPDRYILTTGSYAPHKNLRTLVEAYFQSKLPKENIGLVMAGPNNATGYRAGYQQVTDYAQKLRLSDKARFLPSIPIEDQVILYSNAMMFAITSLYEGFGLTPLEAMACQTPVIASSSSAIPEVCGTAALYADPLDPADFAMSFDTLLQDQELRQTLVSRGQKQILKFDWEECAAQTLQTLVLAARTKKRYDFN